MPQLFYWINLEAQFGSTIYAYYLNYIVRPHKFNTKQHSVLTLKRKALTVKCTIFFKKKKKLYLNKKCILFIIFFLIYNFGVSYVNIYFLFWWQLLINKEHLWLVRWAKPDGEQRLGTPFTKHQIRENNSCSI